MADYRAFNMKDERVHVFRHESPGKWRHYSRPRWEKNAMEREEDNRDWSISEVKDWIAAASPPPEPITDKEIEWVKTSVAKGYEGKSAPEPESDPNRERPRPQFTCVDCHKPFDLKDRRKFSWNTFPPTQGYCPSCFSKRVNGGSH